MSLPPRWLALNDTSKNIVNIHSMVNGVCQLYRQEVCGRCSRSRSSREDWYIFVYRLFVVLPMRETHNQPIMGVTNECRHGQQ